MKKPAHHTMTSKSPMYIYATEMVSALKGMRKSFFDRINILVR